VSLMSITMKLIQKSAYENGAGSAHDIEQWPADYKAVDFLAKIQVARSFDELLDVSKPHYKLCYA
jgi:environmental stress-induced protein Ves